MNVTKVIRSECNQHYSKRMELMLFQNDITSFIPRGVDQRYLNEYATLFQMGTVDFIPQGGGGGGAVPVINLRFLVRLSSAFDASLIRRIV